MHSTKPLLSYSFASFSGKALAAVFLTAALAACGSNPQGAPVTPPSSATDPAHTLQAYDWDLAAAYDGRGQAAPEWQLAGRPAARLHFEKDGLSVQNLCNRLGAGYALDGQRLTVNRPMSTLRACADRELMGLEHRVAAQLPQAQRHELHSGSGAQTPRLVLHFADGSRWELAGSPTPATRYGSAGERIFLEVAPKRVACNHPLMPNAQCLRVRDVHYADNGVKQGVGEWRTFQGKIDVYQHEPASATCCA